MDAATHRDLPAFLHDPDMPPTELPGVGTWFSSAEAAQVIAGSPTFVLDFGADLGNRHADSPSATSMVTANGQRHRDLRGLVARAFTPGATRKLTERIIEIAHEHAKLLLDEGTVVDLVANYARPLPYWVMAEIVGFAPETATRLYRPVWHWIDTEISAAGSVDTITDQSEAWATWQETINKRRSEIAGGAPRRSGLFDDMIIAQLDGTTIDGRALLDDDIVSMLNFLFTAGVATISGGITSIVARIHDDERWWDLAELTGLDIHGGEVEIACWEALRDDPPFPMVRRTALRDTEVQGCPIAHGGVVTANVAAAQRDPAAASERATAARGQAPWSSLLMWGRGPHRCLGEHLAIPEIVEGIRTLMVRYPRLIVVDRGPRPWPSIIPAYSHLRVRLDA